MSKSAFTIKSPNADYNGQNSSVEFRNGVAYTDDAVLANTFKERGYEVTKGGTPHTAAVPESIEPSNAHRAPSSRDAAVEGAAAAGPMSDAFLPPIGAGEGKDPHGTEVVSPGLHAVPPAPVVPGEVSADPATQEAAENEAAKAVLIDGEPVPTTTEGDWKGDENEQGAAGPLGLSDPESAGKGPDAAHPRPAGNASKDAWVAFAVANGMPQDEAETYSRAGLIQKFPEQEA